MVRSTVGLDLVHHMKVGFISIFNSVSDPFHFDKDPDPTLNQKNTNFFSIKNIFPQKFICFVINELNIYVKQNKSVKF